MPAPTAAPFDRGDRGERRPGDTQEPLVDRAEPGPVTGVDEVAEVGTRAERRRRAGDDDCTDALVLLDGIHRRDDLVDHGKGERVPAIGIVERHGRDAICDVDMHEGHAGSLSTEVGSRPTARVASYSDSDVGSISRVF